MYSHRGKKLGDLSYKNVYLKKGTLNAGQMWISMKINQWTEIVTHVNARILELSISFNFTEYAEIAVPGPCTGL